MSQITAPKSSSQRLWRFRIAFNSPFFKMIKREAARSFGDKVRYWESSLSSLHHNLHINRVCVEAIR
jgi:hypothetical protein